MERAGLPGSVLSTASPTAPRHRRHRGAGGRQELGGRPWRLLHRLQAAERLQRMDVLCRPRGCGPPWAGRACGGCWPPWHPAHLTHPPCHPSTGCDSGGRYRECTLKQVCGTGLLPSDTWVLRPGAQAALPSRVTSHPIQPLLPAPHRTGMFISISASSPAATIGCLERSAADALGPTPPSCWRCRRVRGGVSCWVHNPPFCPPGTPPSNPPSNPTGCAWSTLLPGVDCVPLIHLPARSVSTSPNSVPSASPAPPAPAACAS